MHTADTALATPACHWGRIPGARRAGSHPLVWICEYPYRTVRSAGPDRNCEGCPVWAELERTRACGAHTRQEEIRQLHAMLTS